MLIAAHELDLQDTELTHTQLDRSAAGNTSQCVDAHTACKPEKQLMWVLWCHSANTVLLQEAYKRLLARAMQHRLPTSLPCQPFLIADSSSVSLQVIEDMGELLLLPLLMDAT